MTGVVVTYSSNGGVGQALEVTELGGRAL